LQLIGSVTARLARRRKLTRLRAAEQATANPAYDLGLGPDIPLFSQCNRVV
jgi:hypothetical protein